MNGTGMEYPANGSEKAHAFSAPESRKQESSGAHFVQYIEVQYIELDAPLVSWICGVCSLQICAACGMRGTCRRMISRTKPGSAGATSANWKKALSTPA